ncbi:MAG TPA: LuxR C-terminal-related transcriptional regulator [Microthrixaceae bacterium]|nr:LuxR C-terminal-related transcriptional regulator [Microthrixaceae bacterium]
MHSQWPISGRSTELDHLTTLLAGGGTGVLVVGEEGVGKSRVLSEVTDRLRSQGMATVVVTATPGSAVLPLGSLASLLPAGSTSTGLPVLPVLRAAIETLADGRRPVLVIDDVEHLDDASAVLVNQLVATGDAGLAATQTSGTIAPEPIARLWQDGMIERVELPPLTPDELASLAESIVGSPLDDRSFDLVRDMVGGNALFLREILIASRESGNLEVDDGLVRIRELPVSAPRLVDFVRHRVGDLDTVASEALLLIAVGEPLGPGELPPQVSPELLARLDAAGLVTTTLDGHRVVVRLVHHLFGEVLRAAASPLQLQKAHRDLVTAVQAHGSARRGDDLRLAHWSVVGQVDVDPDLLVEAARTARFSQDLELARDLAETAWRDHPDFDTGDLLADIYYELGDTGSAAAIRPRWQELAVDDDQQIRVELNAAVNGFWKEGDADAATAALDRAQAHPPSVWRDEAAAVRSVFLASQGRAAEAVEIAEPLIERDPDRVMIQAAMALTHAYRTQGRVEDAVAVCDRALAAYAELGEQIALISMRVLGVGRTIALAEAGRLEDADSEAARILQLCRTEGEVGGIGLAALVQGWVHFTRGRIRSARQALRLAEDSFARTGHAGMRQWAHIALALVCATSGDAPGAQGWLDAIDRDGLQPAAMFSAALARARAWTAWGAGDPESARDLLIAGSESARGTGDAQGELACLHDLARLGAAEAALERRAGSEPHVQGALNAALADHISAMASGRAAELGDAAEAMADLGAWLWAAEAAYGAADAARREGDPRMAAHWSRRATEWRAACETAATPGLVADLAPVPLTRREREVAILAADGLAAREIGERLYVSRRTVESHLARVYTKLGIGSRAELASLLQDTPR